MMCLSTFSMLRSVHPTVNRSQAESLKVWQHYWIENVTTY